MFISDVLGFHLNSWDTIIILNQRLVGHFEKWDPETNITEVMKFQKRAFDVFTSQLTFFFF